EMDGYEATRRIRSLASIAAQQVPILAMTANVFREDIERCMVAGMNGHIGKPISSPELFAQLDRYLK
ncbi:MAG: response regulator, partial [Symbiobacteriaceae bacterium]|nr:response regulator [Symbiobacteriaceae bacterium]